MITRRAVLATALALSVALPAIAQDKPTLRFSAVFSDKDIRAEMMKQFAEAIADDFTFEPYYGGNLFKQGTELVALQRGNLEMGNIAPQDIANQIPGVVDPDLGLPVPRRRPPARLLRQRARQGDDEAGRGPARHPHPRPDLFRHPPGRAEAGQRRSRRPPTWPASSCGCPAATPGSSSARRSAPTRRRWPMPRSIPACRPARSTARTTRCRTSQNMKFYEVMSQIVLTSHLVGFDLLTISKTAWDAMTPEQQEKVPGGGRRRRSTGARPST